MSLITEALQLRSTSPRRRVSGGESFPPLRRSSPGLKVVAVLAVLCGGGVLVFWKGPWVLELVEGLAGIRVSTPAPAAPAVSTAPPAVAAPAEGGSVPAPAAAPGAVSLAGAAAAGPRPAEIQEAPAPAAKAANLPEELQPMDVNLTLALIEDEKAREQLDAENQKKIEGFLRKMDVQGVCLQGDGSTALLDTVLVRIGDPVGDVGLTLKAIETRRLVFLDALGREYTKSY